MHSVLTMRELGMMLLQAVTRVDIFYYLCFALKCKENMLICFPVSNDSDDTRWPTHPMNDGEECCLRSLFALDAVLTLFLSFLLAFTQTLQPGVDSLTDVYREAREFFPPKI